MLYQPPWSTVMQNETRLHCFTNYTFQTTNIIIEREKMALTETLLK